MTKQNEDITIKRLAQNISICDFLDYREYLNAVYRFCKHNLDTYSFLQMAEELGFSRTNVLHLVIQGKRPLSVKAGEKVVKHLGLTGTERQYFTTLVAYQNARRPDQREELFQHLLALKSKATSAPLAKVQLDYFSEWYHPVIRELVAMVNGVPDSHQIADLLMPRIRPEQARKSLELLEQLGMVTRDSKTGGYSLPQAHISTGDEIDAIGIIRYHQKMLELAKESITLVHERERDVSSITVAVDQEMAQKIKREIQAFRKRIMLMAEGANKADRVYHMNVQLFPSTKPAKGA